MEYFHFIDKNYYIMKIFNTEKEKNEARNKLRILHGTAEWQFFIEEIINPMIDELSRDILEDFVDDKNKELKIRAKRDSFIALRDLPNEIIKQIENSKETTMNFDPYFQNPKEIR